MTHVEDSVIYGGVNGARQAINALRDMRDMLGGNEKGSVSVKWDGAPAVFCGTDPSDGQFFVAKKGIFNKSPKIYKTPEEIDADTSGDLAAKLKDALKYLPELGIKGVIQGDFLFSRRDLKKERIGEEEFITFHPNTIVYAVPKSNAQPLLKAKIGIVWHTTYTGSSFETMKASYGVDVKKFKTSKNVWSQDAFLRDLTTATMTASDTKEVTEYLSLAGKLFNEISGNVLRELESNPDLAKHIEQYNNIYVRKGVVINDTKRHVERLVAWIRTKYQKEASKRSTAAGKDAQNKKMEALLSFFSGKNKRFLKKIFDLQKLLVLAKLKLIGKLNELGHLKTFVKTRKGFKVTGAEGYVAIDRLSGNALKLVDRMEFSYNNFSANVLKGWENTSRS